MRTEYRKLVRDRIPELIRREGRTCATAVLSPSEYIATLKDKLVEEAQEAARADAAGLLAELADIREVVDALAAATGISAPELLQEQTRRRAERGGFENRICLLWVES